ncbi:MAG: hypothetical protein ACM3ZF_00645 [Mycobacterium leprae]
MPFSIITSSWFEALQASQNEVEKRPDLYRELRRKPGPCVYAVLTLGARCRASVLSGNASTLLAYWSGRSPEMRAGAEYFAEPGEPAQRRYEALRAYFVEELSAAQVAARFGYSPAVVHQMASDLRAGRALFFRDSRPGPKGPRKAGRVRDEVLALRAQDRSIDEIAATLAAAGTPVSAQTVWSVLAAEGLERLPRRAAAQRGAPAPRLEPVKARALADWPAGEQVACDHAGLLLLIPGIVELGLPELIAASGYPSTTQLSAWHSLGALLLAKCARVARVSHSDILSDDPGLRMMLGLTALPKATHLSSYSYRVRRAANEQLLAATVRRLRELGLATGEQGFNLDFHAIRHHGTDTPRAERPGALRFPPVSGGRRAALPRWLEPRATTSGAPVGTLAVGCIEVGHVHRHRGRSALAGRVLAGRSARPARRRAAGAPDAGTRCQQDHGRRALVSMSRRRDVRRSRRRVCQQRQGTGSAWPRRMRALRWPSPP